MSMLDRIEVYLKSLDWDLLSEETIKFINNLEEK